MTSVVAVKVGTAKWPTLFGPYESEAEASRFAADLYEDWIREGGKNDDIDIQCPFILEPEGARDRDGIIAIPTPYGGSRFWRGLMNARMRERARVLDEI
jgi:hypothetical protein